MTFVPHVIATQYTITPAVKHVMNPTTPRVMELEDVKHMDRKASRKETTLEAFVRFITVKMSMDLLTTTSAKRMASCKRWPAFPSQY
jgi:hypothetical protein